MFPPFTGPGPCQKCGTSLLTFWHPYGYSNWAAPRDPGPCHEADGWPQVEGGPLEPENQAEEEHLHRFCPGCGHQAIEALTSPDQVQPTARYDLVYGVKAINDRAAKGWKVVEAMMPGTDVVALMLAP